MARPERDEHDEGPRTKYSSFTRKGVVTVRGRVTFFLSYQLEAQQDVQRL